MYVQNGRPFIARSVAVHSPFAAPVVRIERGNFFLTPTISKTKRRKKWNFFCKISIACLSFNRKWLLFCDPYTYRFTRVANKLSKIENLTDTAVDKF